MEICVIQTFFCIRAAPFRCPFVFSKTSLSSPSLACQASSRAGRDFFLSLYRRSTAIFTNLARFNHDLWAWSGWSTAAQIVESPNDNDDDDDAEAYRFSSPALFLPESRNRRAPFVKVFLFRPPWSRSPLSLSQNHDLLRVIEEDH